MICLLSIVADCGYLTLVTDCAYLALHPGVAALQEGGEVLVARGEPDEGGVVHLQLPGGGDWGEVQPRDIGRAGEQAGVAGPGGTVA